MIASVGRADRVPDTAVAVRAYVNGRLMAWALLLDEQFGHAHSTPRAHSGARSEGPENRSFWNGCISMPRVSTLGPGAIGWRSPPDRDEQPVREFRSFTHAFIDLADWLTACDVDTVAMESTGVYWIPL